LSLVLPASPALRYPPSFPTRRSSDLPLSPARHSGTTAHPPGLRPLHLARPGGRVARRRDARSVPDDPRRLLGERRRLVGPGVLEDRKSTRLNSSHLVISYAVFCLKKK